MHACMKILENTKVELPVDINKTTSKRVAKQIELRVFAISYT